jgi:glycosyltransferase involved in cell wall biosynthesis
MSETAILLCTYNGAEYLQEQLNSLAKQTVAWRLFVSDDGSSDDTLLFLNDFAKHHEVTIFKGPQKGFVQNFLSLINRPEVTGDFYAFCDQDDVWLKDKLARGLEFLRDKPEPQLYCSRTTTACYALHPIGLSPLFRRKPTFNNALVQSIAGANTFIFNNATRDLVIKAGITNVISHDWWLYQLVTGAEGQVFYDESSYILYRQRG